MFFNAVDYQMAKEAEPTDNKGKLKKTEKDKLTKQADKLRKLQFLDYFELQEEYLKKKKEKEVDEIVKKVNLNTLKITLKK